MHPALVLLPPINLPSINAKTAQDPVVDLFTFGPAGAHAHGRAFAPTAMELPLLTDGPTEHWQVSGGVERWQQRGLFGAQSSDYLFLLLVSQPQPRDLRSATREAYGRLLREAARCGFSELVRCWNYVPEINAGSGDAEHYKQFCWGRAEAIGEHSAALPAATGIGSFDGVLRIAMLASRPRPDLHHLENPRQVSAYRYPRQYGPRSPSFARATWIGSGVGGLLLVSGTASIVDHANRHEDDLLAQLTEVRRNVAALVAGAEALHEANAPLAPIAVRLYVRDSKALASLLHRYESLFSGFPAPLACQGDICRLGLGLEVEVVFRSSG